MAEIWKPIEGYEEDYAVSNCGNVKSLFRYKKQLKPSVSKNGYLTVSFCKKRFLVHRLVAKAFIPNPECLPQVNHRDENKQNNCVDNLEWCSAKYNMNYGVAAKTRHAKIDYSKPVFAENARLNGAKVSKPVLQFSKDGTFVAQFESGKQAHLKTKINHSHIMECCSEKRKTAGGYVWKYEERNDDLSESQS